MKSAVTDPAPPERIYGLLSTFQLSRLQWLKPQGDTMDGSNLPIWLYQKPRLIVCAGLYVFLFAIILVATRELKPAVVGTGVVILIVEITASCHYWQAKAYQAEQRAKNTRRR